MDQVAGKVAIVTGGAGGFGGFGGSGLEVGEGVGVLEERKWRSRGRRVWDRAVGPTNKGRRGGWR